MSRHFTDRDERMWQLRAEGWAARPLPLGTWLRRLRTARKPVSTPAPARPRPVEQA